MVTQSIKLEKLSDWGITVEQWNAAQSSEERIERIETESGVYWLKKSAPARGVFRYIALNFLCKMMKAPLLKAVPQKGNQEALDTETRRLSDLAKAGICVPRVLAREPGWILLNDLGESIIEEMKSKRQDQQRIRNLFGGCLQSIKELHLQGQYLSQGFVRNILKVSEEPLKMGFIDFEDDPLSVLTLQQAQARDLLLFINSTARFFVKDSEYFKGQVKDFLDGHDPEVIEQVQSTNKKLLWITKLPFQKLLGHDYRKLKIGILALDFD